jgi:hypothetical protein
MASNTNSLASGISRKIGTLLLFGIPALIGGGTVYHFSGSFTAMLVYEAILGLAALGFISR